MLIETRPKKIIQQKQIKKKKKERKNMKCFVQMIYKIAETLIVIPRFRLLSSKEDT